jgi:hypothetical protein
MSEEEATEEPPSYSDLSSWINADSPAGPSIAPPEQALYPPVNPAPAGPSFSPQPAQVPPRTAVDGKFSVIISKPPGATLGFTFVNAILCGHSDEHNASEGCFVSKVVPGGLANLSHPGFRKGARLLEINGVSVINGIPIEAISLLDTSGTFHITFDNTAVGFQDPPTAPFIDQMAGRTAEQFAEMAHDEPGCRAGLKRNQHWKSMVLTVATVTVLVMLGNADSPSLEAMERKWLISVVGVIVILYLLEAMCSNSFSYLRKTQDGDNAVNLFSKLRRTVPYMH